MKKVKIIYTVEDYATVNELTDADAIEAAKEVSFNRSLNGMTVTDVECFVVETYENDNI